MVDPVPTRTTCSFKITLVATDAASVRLCYRCRKHLLNWHRSICLMRQCPATLRGFPCGHNGIPLECFAPPSTHLILSSFCLKVKSLRVLLEEISVKKWRGYSNPRCSWLTNFILSNICNFSQLVLSTHPLFALSNFVTLSIFRRLIKLLFQQLFLLSYRAHALCANIPF